MKSTVACRRSRRLFAERIEQLEARQLLAANVISGYVFNDLENNGELTLSDPLLNGSTIELINSQGTVIGTTTVQQGGYYQFSVDQSAPTTPQSLTETITVPVADIPFSNTQSIPQFNPGLGTLTSVAVTNNAAVTDTIMFENKDTSPHTLTATVQGSVTTTGPGITDLVANTTDSVSFNASGFDGTVDFGGTSGITFAPRTVNNSATETLTDPADLATYTAASATSIGTVSFTDSATATSSVTGSGNVVSAISTVAGGTITVVYTYTPNDTIQPGNYTIVQTTQPPGFINGLNSSNGVVLTATRGNNTIPVTVTAGTNVYGANNFGEVQALSSLTGSVFLDTNNDGVREPSEFGIANVTVDLTGRTSSGVLVNQTTTTNYYGDYTFSNLAAGTYSITEIQPTEFIKGKNHLGSLGGTVSRLQFSSISVPLSANGVSYDFGERARAACKLADLTAVEHKLAPSQVGPLIRYYLPSLVPVLLRPAAVTKASPNKTVAHHASTADRSKK